MRIVFIITGLSTGGAEMMLLKVLERLDRHRFVARVISLTTLGELGPRIAALGIPVDAMGMKPGLPSPSGFLRLVRILKRLSPDVVHTWMYHADLLGGLAARLAGISAVCWGVRSSNLDRDKTRWTTRAVRRLCAVLSRVIPQSIFFNSETARQIHLSLGYAAERMVVVPNGFNLSCFRLDEGARHEVRAELNLSDETPLVGMVGRFDPLKNHAGFFEAMKILNSRMPEAHFLLAGQGIDDANVDLMRLRESVGMLANTHLLGLRKDMPRLMAALDVLVCPSHAEAFPNVAGEAMACGVPCVVTDVGDCAYIVGDTGRVVATGDMAGLASAVVALLELPAVEKATLGENARARVAAHFEIGWVVSRYEESYESL
jgi:glycosyltransferase involved in cell wall biosynthesis